MEETAAVVQLISKVTRAELQEALLRGFDT
jgi:hypothetical protein